MGIEPRCTWSSSRLTPRWSSRQTPRFSSSKGHETSWVMKFLFHEICKWLQNIEIPKDFTFGWCNQKPQKVNYIFGDLIHDSNWFSEAWNEHWSCFCADDVQVTKMMTIHSLLTAGIGCCYLSLAFFILYVIL